MYGLKDLVLLPKLIVKVVLDCWNWWYHKWYKGCGSRRARQEKLSKQWASYCEKTILRSCLNLGGLCESGPCCWLLIIKGRTIRTVGLSRDQVVVPGCRLLEATKFPTVVFVESFAGYINWENRAHNQLHGSEKCAQQEDIQAHDQAWFSMVLVHTAYRCRFSWKLCSQFDGLSSVAEKENIIALFL